MTTSVLKLLCCSLDYKECLWPVLQCQQSWELWESHKCSYRLFHVTLKQQEMASELWSSADKCEGQCSPLHSWSSVMQHCWRKIMSISVKCNFMLKLVHCTDYAKHLMNSQEICWILSIVLPKFYCNFAKISSWIATTISVWNISILSEIFLLRQTNVIIQKLAKTKIKNTKVWSRIFF